MTIEEKIMVAKKVNGTLGTGKLNWLGDYNMEFKKEQFSIFFTKYSQVEKALILLKDYNNKFVTKIVKTPKHVNNYFKHSITIFY